MVVARPLCYEALVFYVLRFMFYVRDKIRPFLYRKAVSSDASEQRVLRSTPDWSETANNSEHLWVPTSASGDFCYVGESDCTVSTKCLAAEREKS